MDPALRTVLAVLLGAGLGIALVLLIQRAARRGRHAVEAVRADLPDGAIQVIEILESYAVVLDPSFNVVRASPGAVAFGLVWSRSLVHPELVALADRARSAGEPVSEDVAVMRGRFGDELVHLRVRVAPLGLRHLLLLADDHTESRRLDEVRRDFIANISHELKTPIGAVGLLAEALQATGGDAAAVQRFAEQLQNEARRLATLTHEIIELSRLQSADPLRRAQEVGIDAIIATAIDGVRVVAEARGVDIVCGGVDEIRVFGDAAWLSTAVQNLLANAVQYSPDGGRVGVGVSRLDGGVEIAITDQGPGIAESDLDRIFERFYRVDEARSRATGGSGLGLSIVKHVVQNHGGDVRAWSQPGRGSTFTIRLPEATDVPQITAAERTS